MAYTKTTWVNDSQPAISAENLNNIENGIAALDTAVGSTDISSVGDGTVTGAISTLNSSLTVQNLTANVTLDTYGDSLGSSTFYRIGNIVIVSLDVNIVANTPANGAILQGLPIPYTNNNRVYANAAKHDGTSIRINVTTEGKVVVADANNTSVWISASFSYVAR